MNKHTMKRSVCHNCNHERRHVTANHVPETRFLVDLVDHHATLLWKRQLLLFHALEKRIETMLLLNDGFVAEGRNDEHFDFWFLMLGLPRNRLQLPEPTGNRENKNHFVRRATVGNAVITSSSSSGASSLESGSSGMDSEGLSYCTTESEGLGVGFSVLDSVGADVWIGSVAVFSSCEGNAVVGFTKSSKGDSISSVGEATIEMYIQFYEHL